MTLGKFKTVKPEKTEEERALDLAKRVIAATDRIPTHVLNGSQQTAAAFKRDAHKARKSAEDRLARKNLAKMIAAWDLVSPYYQSTP